jgi:uncharacterized protein YeaO (DUF488 family)
MSFRLRMFRVGSTPTKAQGLRIGAVRYLPRGVRKENYATENHFDVWLPVLAPSRELLHWLRDQQKAKGDTEEVWAAFLHRYERQLLTSTDTRQTLLLLAELARRTPLSIGCYCEHDEKCHRSRLYEIIQRVAVEGLP